MVCSITMRQELEQQTRWQTLSYHDGMISWPGSPSSQAQGVADPAHGLLSLGAPPPEDSAPSHASAIASDGIASVAVCGQHVARVAGHSAVPGGWGCVDARTQLSNDIPRRQRRGRGRPASTSTHPQYARKHVPVVPGVCPGHSQAPGDGWHYMSAVECCGPRSRIARPPYADRADGYWKDAGPGCHCHERQQQTFARRRCRPRSARGPPRCYTA
jgi:hypothetical protein